MSSLKSDGIYFPAFEHCHNKPSRPGSLKSRACYTQLSTDPLLPSSRSPAPFCIVTSNSFNVSTSEKAKLLNKTHGLTDQSTLSVY